MEAANNNEALEILKEIAALNLENDASTHDWPELIGAVKRARALIAEVEK